MRDVKKQLNTACRLCLVFLLISSLLCGCGISPAPANTADPTPMPKPAATPTPTPTPDPEELARRQRLSDAKDGFVWEDGYLEAIDEEGNLLTDCYIGILHFGKDGRYTSGSKDLDRLTAKVVRDNTDLSMTRMEMLRAMYDYTMGNIEYLVNLNYECSFTPAHGKDGWMPELAVKALETGRGNCYSYAAVFAALARAVGFQAYATGGGVGAGKDPHGWVQIVDEDGNEWLNDPEIEYRYGDYYERVQSLETAPDLFYKAPDMIGAETGMDYVPGCDPYEAEAKEAEERENGTAEDTEEDSDSAENPGEDGTEIVDISVPQQ